MSDDINLRSLGSAPEYKTQILKLLEDHFPQERVCSRKIPLQQEFPILLQDDNIHRVLFLEKNNEVIATASWAPFQFDFGKSSLKCGALGLIVTDPKYQSQGYSSYLVLQCEEMAAKENTSFCVLWSNLREHYEKMGYLICGFEEQWTLNKKTLLKLPEDKSLPLLPLQDIRDISKFYEQGKIGPTRNWDIYQNFLKMPDTFCIKGPSSYAFMGKARDLHNCIHEINGNPKEFPSLLKRLATNIDESELSILMPSASKATPAIRALLGEGTRGAFAFAKLLDGPNFIEKVARASITPKDMEISVSKEGFKISQYKKEIFSSADFTHFLQLFMGPLRIEEFEDLEDSQKDALAQIQVPNIYFWGFDSV